MSIYNFTVKDASGQDVSIKDYQGKVLLIVNTATGCGLTPQYEGLQDLYEKYRDQGFEILDFPSNQFANQAPGSDDEIKSFCETRFGVTFKIFHKIDVNGDNADPLFTYLKKEKGGSHFPVSQKNTTANRPKIGLYSLGKGNHLILNKHLSGIKKARCLFEPITETHRTAPAV